MLKAPIKFDFALCRLPTVYPDRMLNNCKASSKLWHIFEACNNKQHGNIMSTKMWWNFLCFRENPLAKLQDLKLLDEGYLILLTPQSFCHVWICWHVVFSFLGITYILLWALYNTEQNNFFGGLTCVNLEVRLEMKLTCNLLESADRERGKVLFPSPPKKREEGPLDCRLKWNNKDQRKCVFPWQTFQPFEYVKSGY